MKTLNRHEHTKGISIKRRVFIIMSDVIKVAGCLTVEQIEESTNNIIRPFEDNSLPQLRLQNNGVFVQLTKEEIDASCASVYEGILR